MLARQGMMMERMSQRLDNLSARMDHSSGASTPTPMGDTTPSSTSVQTDGGRSWADIPVDELADYTAPLVCDDDMEDRTHPLVQVSENTAKVLKTAFGRPLSNQSRLQARKPYPFPNVETTRCPKLDPVAKQLMQRDQKQADASMAKIQTLVLDVVAPLVYIAEEATRGSLSGEQAAEAAKAALFPLGNASVHVSKKRRR